MATNQNFDESVKTLKKTIPLMMKYSVPVNPTNYALWFTYTSNEVPSLNKELDAIIQLYDTCPKFKTEQLYNKHIQNDVVDQAKTLQRSINCMVDKVGNSIGLSKQGAKDFENAMTLCHDELKEIDSIKTPISQNEISGFVGDLLNKSLTMRDNAKDFSLSLDKAQEEIKTLRLALESSQQDALSDVLTGLLNRRAFEQEIDELLNLSNANSYLIIADIDHFKIFNDKHGHVLGDQVLKTVGKRLETACEYHKGLAFRFGGEEFALLLPKSTITLAHQLAENIRQSIERLVIKDKTTSNTIANITCSFGVAPIENNATSSIKLADTRMYKAKKEGRNKVVST